MPHEETPATLAIELPFGVWLGVESALKKQRYELQRWLATKTGASSAARRATEHALDEVTRAINAIVDRTSSV
jgi:hypothetical protein